MAGMVFDPGSGEYVYSATGDEPGALPGTSGSSTTTTSTSSAPTSVAPSAPTGSTYNIGSGQYTVDTGAMNLSDPNQLMATGLTASQMTTQPYRPLVSNTPAPTGDTMSQAMTNNIWNQATNPYLLPQTTMTYTPIDPNATPNLTYNPIQGNYSANATLGVAPNAPNINQTNPYTYQATSYSPTMATAAQGTVDPNSVYSATSMQAAQGTVNPNSTYQAATFDPAQMKMTPDMEVQNQFSALMSEDADGNGVPDWSQTAVTQSQQMANSMGLGNSTMALGATSTAIFNVALPMAEMNAQTAYNIGAINTANAQQANMANTAAINASQQYNASVWAQTQMLNTQNAQQANYYNAQFANNAAQYDAAVYAQMNFQNLLNQQQTLLSNQSYSNAAAQFNAQAQNTAGQFNAQQQQQNSQFFSSLNASINQQNADRQAQMSQFNAGQTNSMAQFNENLNAQVDEFNAQNQLLVDQANVNWQRSVNTANTAGINAVNQANAMNMFNMQQTDMNMIWQQSADEASWALTSAENSQNRLLSLTNSALNRQTSLSILNSQMQANMFSNLGALSANLLTPVVTSASNSLFSTSSTSSDIGADFGGGGDLIT